MAAAKKAPQIRAPSFLTRSEKRVFASVVSAHSGRGKSISAWQAAALGDFVAARSRLAALALVWRAEVREARAGAFGGDNSRIIAVTKQIDATTALSRRLAREAGLE